MLFPLALMSWLLIGLIVGLAARRMLPGGTVLNGLGSALAGIGGALAGGLLATWLGFGGLAGYDLRALATATLGAVLGSLLGLAFKFKATGDEKQSSKAAPSGRG